MTHRRHDRTMSRLIDSELVVHQPPGFTSLALSQTAEAQCSRTLMATTLHENVYGIPYGQNTPPTLRYLQYLPISRNYDFETHRFQAARRAAPGYCQLQSDVVDWTSEAHHIIPTYLMDALQANSVLRVECS